jgi:hypothetical protein
VAGCVGVRKLMKVRITNRAVRSSVRITPKLNPLCLIFDDIAVCYNCLYVCGQFLLCNSRLT